jgi:hypothetical protein
MLRLAIAPEALLLRGDLPLAIGALFFVVGVGLLWWGVLSLRDGERRPGIVCTLSGVLLVASALSLYGVF